MRVSRARASVTFPAKVLLVAAMNPCPCGEGGPPGACPCNEAVRHRYVRRVSGPLVDRFDLRVPVMRPNVDDLLGAAGGESTACVAARVAAARARARERGVESNSEIPSTQLDEVAPLTRAAAALLRRELEAGRLSGRGLHRVRRVGAHALRSPRQRRGHRRRPCRGGVAAARRARRDRSLRRMNTPCPDEAYGVALAVTPDDGSGAVASTSARAGRPRRHGSRSLRVARSTTPWSPPRAVVMRHKIREVWARVAKRIEPHARAAAVGARPAIAVHLLGRAGYPPELAADAEAPAVCFVKGDATLLASPARVAIIGTRSATAPGLDLAHRLGHDLAEAGVSIVSGLARGIDAAAHRGALTAAAAPPIGVVGSGLDVVYPSNNAKVWAAVAESRSAALRGTARRASVGMAVSGAQPPHRMPRRHRRSRRVTGVRRLDAHGQGGDPARATGDGGARGRRAVLHRKARTS